MNGEDITNVPPEVDFPRDGAKDDAAWRSTLEVGPEGARACA